MAGNNAQQAPLEEASGLGEFITVSTITSSLIRPIATFTRHPGDADFQDGPRSYESCSGVIFRPEQVIAIRYGWRELPRNKWAAQVDVELAGGYEPVRVLYIEFGPDDPQAKFRAQQIAYLSAITFARNCGFLSQISFPELRRLIERHCQPTQSAEEVTHEQQ